MKTTHRIALAPSLLLAAMAVSSCSTWHLDRSHSRPMDPSRPSTTVSIDKAPDNHTVSVQPSKDPHGDIGLTFSDNPAFKYFVDNHMYTDEVRTEEDITTLYIKILGFAKLGRKITITSQSKPAAVDDNLKLTFTSPNETDVIAWSKKMLHLGFSVTIDFDKTTRLYHCTATKE
ncbi:MAG: hypothetical protein IJ745_05055 [Bacteroidales bacterium]|nr:hypothetical protein [Bacteroidales bacterium]